MKKALTTLPRILAIVLPLALATACGSQDAPPPAETQATPDPQAKLAAKQAPADHFAMMRAYPDPSVDIRAYEAALDQARNIPIAKTASSGLVNTPWRTEGPTNLGGRINAIAIDPNNPSTILTGSAGSGIWKTTDAGNTWTPIFESANFLTIGDITFQPGSSSIIWVGTGDPNISGYPGIGDGIYKSTDGGANWTNMGLADQRIISRVIVDPNDPDRIYAACMGLPMERNNDRGLYLSTNGGTTWTQSLFVTDQTGIIDLVMDPNNNQVLYASSWDRIRNNQESTVDGPNAKVWKTTDGGGTWTALGGGLPTIPLSRVNLTNHPTNSNILYACYVGTDLNVYNIYKTTNAGSSWAPIDISSLDPFAVGGFGWYFSDILLNPFDPSQLYLCGIQLWRTTNDGNTWEQVDPDWFNYDVHADKHDIAFTSASSMLLATDGGLYRTTNTGVTWTDADEIPNSEFYRIEVSPHSPSEYYGGMQDNGTSGGNYLSTNTWPRLFGGDGFQVRFTNDPSEAIVETQNGGLYYLDNLGGGPFTFGIDPADRTNWDQPISQSPFDPYICYTGTYRIYQTTGFPLSSHFWTPISPDLTDGNVFGSRFHTISTIEESPKNSLLLYAGTSDGNVHRSDDGGISWISISAGIPKRYVTTVRPSPHDADEVYLTISGYKYNDYIPHVFRSTNRGSTWMDISGDLPALALNDIIVHPSIDSILIVASDGGVYASTNRGQNWTRIGNNMPMIPVYDLEWDIPGNRLVAGTHARSIMSFPTDSIVSSTIVGLPSAPLSLELYPNPASDEVRLRGEIKQGEWELRDLNGRLLRAGKANHSYPGASTSISLQGLPQGAYLFRVQKSDAVWSQRVIKQ